MTASPFHIPEGPSDPDSLVGEESGSLRYEDISQDGRIRLEGVWHPTGRLLWSGHDLGARIFRLGRDHGIRTVLSRVVIETSGHPVAPRVPARTGLRYRFEHAVDADRRVNRLFFSTWLRTDAPVPDQPGGFGRAGGDVRWIARAYGQRTFARLDAPPGQRSVTALPDVSGDGVPPHRGEWVDAERLLEPPPGAELLERAPRRSPLPIVFGLSHTDANQHVNFLSYPRYLEQAALGRFVALGEGAVLLARRVELAYRRPSFAGETLGVVLQAFRWEGDLGVLAAFVEDDGGVDERESFSAFGAPRCVARMLLSR